MNTDFLFHREGAVFVGPASWPDNVGVESAAPSQGCGQMTISEAHDALTHQRCDVHVSLRGLYRDRSRICRGGRRHAGGMTYGLGMSRRGGRCHAGGMTYGLGMSRRGGRRHAGGMTYGLGMSRRGGRRHAGGVTYRGGVVLTGARRQSQSPPSTPSSPRPLRIRPQVQEAG